MAGLVLAPLRIPLRTLPSLDGRFSIGKKRTDWSTIRRCNMDQTRLGPELPACWRVHIYYLFLYNYITSPCPCGFVRLQNLSLSPPHSHSPLSLSTSPSSLFRLQYIFHRASLQVLNQFHINDRLHSSGASAQSCLSLVIQLSRSALWNLAQA